MDREAKNDSEYTVSTRTAEAVVAGLLMIVGAVIMWENWKIGASWSDFGPESGYFPFRTGAVLFLASGIVFFTALGAKAPNLDSFVDRSQLKAVFKVLVPTAVFVIAIGYLGLYVAGAFYIAFFMWWLGKYPLHKIVPVALFVPFALFVLFDIWFLVPMPKGPLEAALGY